MSKEFYIDRSMSIRKAVIIYQVKGSIHSPIMYLKKPKWVSNDDFNDFLDKMQIQIKIK